MFFKQQFDFVIESQLNSHINQHIRAKFLERVERREKKEFRFVDKNCVNNRSLNKFNSALSKFGLHTMTNNNSCNMN